MNKESYARFSLEGLPSRSSIRRTLRSVYLSTGGFFSQRDSRPALRCLCCHHVFDDQVVAFEQKILFLLNQGVFVDTETCLSFVSGKKPIDGVYYHLSFDDGYRNIIQNALPILKKYQIPSLFFVTTGLIGASFDKSREFSSNVTRYKAPLEMCTWDDLKKGVDCGMEIGSHTKTHERFLSILPSPDRIDLELLGSKLDIELRLGVSCRTIACPYGKVPDLGMDGGRKILTEIGYEAGFAAFRGTIRQKLENPFFVPRHHFEPEWPLTHLQYFIAR